MSGAGGQPPDGARLRPASARARSEGEGIVALDAFSRGGVIDRAWMGWGALRVLSRQHWAPGAVRDEGRVANMERLLVVLEGVLAADCAGLGRHRVEAGSALWLGAGHGMVSRLANASDAEPLRLAELWLQPDRVNAAPWLALVPPPPRAAAPAWMALAAAGPEAQHDGARPPRPRTQVLEARLQPGERLALPAGAGARYWLDVLAGDALVESGVTADGAAGVRLGAGDGLGWLAADMAPPASVRAGGHDAARVLLVALPA